MSNYSKILLKMNVHIQNFPAALVYALHPAAGKDIAEKKKRRSSAITVNPKATPDSLNIRDAFKKQDSFRRSPAP